MASLLPAGHPYRNGVPVSSSFTPARCGSLVIDSWDFATVTASGGEPDESVTRATYRAVASIADKYLTGESYTATGDVRHTRPDEEPYGAIATVRGRRGLHFATTGTTAAYISVTARGLRGITFTGATVSRPLRIIMAVRLRGGATRLGDGTLWDRNGWRAVVSADLATVTINTPAATSGGTTAFPLPHPTEDYARYWFEWTYDGSSWTFRINGEAKAASSTVAPVGALTSTAGTVMTIGGRAANALEHEVDFVSVGMGDSQAANIAQWREDTAVPMSWGSTYHRHLFDCADAYYSTFQGDDGLGLTLREVTLATDTSSNSEWWNEYGGGKNRCVIVRYCGVAEREAPFALRNQTLPKDANRLQPHGVFINASGGPFAAAGAEHQIKSDGTKCAHHTIMKGIGGGGPFTYAKQRAAEGAFVYIYGDNPAVTSTPQPLSHIVLKDCWSAFTSDNALTSYYFSEKVFVANFVAVGLLRNTNHAESPNHDFGWLIGDGATKYSAINPVFLNENQRVPALLGTHGDAITAADAKGSWVGGLSMPHNDHSRNSGSGHALFGQPSNDPGANTGNAHLSVRQHIWKPRAATGGETQRPYALVKKAGAGSPAQGSTLHSIGNYFANSSALYLAGDTDTAAVVANKPVWSGGERLFPVTEAGILAVAEESISRLPSFVRTLYATYTTGAIKRHDMFTSDPAGAAATLNPSNAGDLATLNGLLSPTTVDWSLPGNAALAATEFTGLVRPWAEITNGTTLQPLIGTKVAPATLWPLVAALLLS